MGEVDESIITASENNIIVDGIKYFPDSPHDVNKKAFIFRMGKGIEKWYKSRLRLNMFKLPESEYVHFNLANDFFPSAMDEIIMNVVSISLNIAVNSQPNCLRNTVDPSFTCT